MYTDQQRTTDNDDDVTLSAPELKMVGQITVDLHRGTMGEDTKRRAAPTTAKADVGIASERSKK